jgi:hypothetical protein
MLHLPSPSPATIVTQRFSLHHLDYEHQRSSRSPTHHAQPSSSQFGSWYHHLVPSPRSRPIEPEALDDLTI